ncbi:MAG: cobalamin-dependent protein [Chloroflexota bacterium]|nr:cobalamin-dependent protein [Chloroflexota bacterium]
MSSDEPRPAAEPVADVLSAFRMDYLGAMRAGSGRAADRVVERALDEHIIVNDIYLSIFQTTAYEIGRLWQRNEFSVAQEHLATAIIERQMGDLHQQFKPRRDRKRTLVIGAVERELHRIGSRMVADFFEQDGWTVHYLGAAVPTDTFIAMAKDMQADLIGLSSQMVYHVPTITAFVHALDQQGLGGIPVMAGGLPFVQQPTLYQSLGVRFSGADARAALRLADSLFPSDEEANDVTES